MISYVPNGREVKKYSAAALAAMGGMASMVLSADTVPKLVCASHGAPQRTDGGTTGTNQHFATKIRQNIIGRYKAIGVVYLSRRWSFSVKKPFDQATPDAIATISAALELPDGTQTLNFNSSNNGGTIIPLTFQGRSSARLVSGDLLISDLVWASDHGREFWEFENTDLSQPLAQPWVRTAFTKTNASDLLWIKIPSTNQGVAPNHNAVAAGTSFAQMQTLINTSGIASYNGTNQFGFGDSDNAPGPFMIVGIPADESHESVVVIGTSIPFGETQRDRNDWTVGVAPFGTGTDWSAVTWDSRQFNGWPSWAGCHPTKAFPCLNLAIGAGALLNTFNETAAAGTWDIGLSTYVDYMYQRWLLAMISRFCTVFVAHDVHNDNVASDDEYRAACRSFTRWIKQVNPTIKIIGARVPNGGVNLSGSNVAFTSSLATKWAIQDELVAAGFWDGMADLRLNGVNEYPNEGTQFSGTAASGSTTTVINLPSNLLTPNEFSRSWITINSQKRVISRNERNSITVAVALSGAPSAGDAFQIDGNWAGGTDGTDLVHSNTFGARRMADRFHSEIARIIPSFKFYSHPR